MVTEAAEEAPPAIRCDTCGRVTDRVTRVVVDAGYNRANARPVYNCDECYRKKLVERTGESAPAA